MIVLFCTIFQFSDFNEMSMFFSFVFIGFTLSLYDIILLITRETTCVSGYVPVM